MSLKIGIFFLLPTIITFNETTYAQTPTDLAALKNDTNYRIGSGDVLKVLVVKQPLLSADNVRVNNDGSIRLPMIQEQIPVACLTESELASELIAKYKKYLLNPQVYVTVTAFNANQVAVVGAVNTPGRFQLQRPTKLLELITYVNGPAQTAGKNVQIIRTANANVCAPQNVADGQNIKFVADETGQEVISLPLADVLKGEESANPFVQAGDIIRIAEAELRQAYIVGSVRSAMTINLKEPVTLSNAIAMAGGAVSGANLEKVKLLRQKPGSLAKSETIINVKNINKRSQDDIVLEPNDIIDVPGPSGSRKLLKDIFRTVIPAVTRVPVVIP